MGNKAHPEGSIAETYKVKECITFLSMYLGDVETKFNRADRNVDCQYEAEKGTISVFAQRASPFGTKKSFTKCNGIFYTIARKYFHFSGK